MDTRLCVYPDGRASERNRSATLISIRFRAMLRCDAIAVVLITDLIHLDGRFSTVAFASGFLTARCRASQLIASTAKIDYASRHVVRSEQKPRP